MSSLSVALSALQAHQQSMLVTSQNLANAGSTGYSQQRTTLTANTLQIGRTLSGGVTATGITSSRSQVQDAHILAATSTASALDMTTSTLSSLEAYFGEIDGVNLQTQMEAVADAFNDLAENPDDDAVASAVVGSLSVLTSLLNQTAQGVSAVAATVISDADAGTERANTLLSELASLNSTIAITGNSGSNEFADRQALVLEELAGLIQVSASWADDGTVSVSCNGDSLVAGSSYLKLAMSTSTSGDIHLVAAESGIRIGNASGKIGACEDLVNTTLPELAAQLDDIALSLIDYLGTQQSIGADGGDGTEEMISATTFSSAQITQNIDEIAYDSLHDLGPSLAAEFPDSGTASVMCLNAYDSATGLASTHVLVYDAGSGPTPASRTLNDVVDAINSGNGGGFTLVPPAAGALTASLRASSGGFKLVISSTDGRTIDCGTAIDASSATAPASQWSASDAGFTLSGSYDGGAQYDPATAMTIAVSDAGTIGDDSDPPSVVVSIPVEKNGVVTMQSTTVTLDSTHPAGVPIALGNGLEITFSAGSLSLSADPLTVVTDASDDRSGFLGAVGLDRLLIGHGAADISIAQEISGDPSRIATGSSRTNGDNDIANAMADLVTAATGTTSGIPVGTAYQGLVSRLGQAINDATSMGEVQSMVLTTLENQRQILIGVDVDEQTALLIEQQQAYTAAAQVITMVRQNIATLMSILD